MRFVTARKAINQIDIRTVQKVLKNLKKNCSIKDTVKYRFYKLKRHPSAGRVPTPGHRPSTGG